MTIQNINAANIQQFFLNKRAKQTLCGMRVG